MQNFFDVNPNDLTMTTASLQRILEERGWRAKFLRGTHQYIFAERPDGETFNIAGSAPEMTSRFSGIIADDKLATYELLKDLGVPQAETKIATAASISALLSKYGRIVIKPIDGAHGNGITTGITNLDDALIALELAEKFSDSGRALVQQQLDFDGPETRAICIDYKFVEALNRIPAQVTGDGTHTVSELIDIENSTIRTEAYKSSLAFIDREYAEQYMREKNNANYVPKPDEKVQVIKMCNIGRGGTVEDVSESFSDDKKQLSKCIATALDLPVIGIDFLGDYVLEVNASPSLYYPLPDEKKANFGVEKLVDYLENF